MLQSVGHGDMENAHVVTLPSREGREISSSEIGKKRRKGSSKRAKKMWEIGHCCINELRVKIFLD
jgi:hypothetical protein